ncbi:hypothetical protein GOB87_14655 [Acetobacter estunensis]|uniref:Uncharacterized protein n=1 Tax=Acetobacter estunensis TaxID=104097 RepID=A0A967EEK9_9PROT|nr:hypothetical protein [Acetobacter estunensis]NHO55165.1 hypothetical protein [Acetobacter estunensis]
MISSRPYNREVPAPTPERRRTEPAGSRLQATEKDRSPYRVRISLPC